MSSGTLATWHMHDGHVQMKLMGKGNQMNKPENQITITDSPMN